MNIQEMMKAAQTMQAKLQEAQDRLDTVEVQGEAGAGLVHATTTGKGRLLRLRLDPSLLPGLLSDTDKEMLEDLIVAAVNDARSKAEDSAQKAMASLTQGMGLPPGMKLPF